jgi:hypothetical protein
MIKFMLQAIPSYVMSVYLIPETTIWWGEEELIINVLDGLHRIECRTRNNMEG